MRTRDDVKRASVNDRLAHRERLALTHREAVHKLLMLALGSGAVGVGMRGVGGLMHAASDPGRLSNHAARPLIIDLPTPPKRRRPGVEEPDGPPVKLAGDPAPGKYTGDLGGVWSRAKDWLVDLFKPTNDKAEHWYEHSYTWPLAVGAVGGGLYGGYKAMDNVMDARHRRQTETQVEKARRRYQRAMAAQFNRPKAAHAPLAASGRAAAALDALAAMAEKRASMGVDDYIKGIYLTAAGLAAAGTGIGTYRYMRDRDPDLLLEKAVKERERQRRAGRPAEVYLRTRERSSPPVRLQGPAAATRPV